MRVERLWVPRDVGKYFWLGDIKVGKNSVFASVGEFSMAVFDNDQLHEPGQYPDPCIGIISPYLWVGLRVRNGGPSTAVFSGHLEGTIVSEEEATRPKRKLAESVSLDDDEEDEDEDEEEDEDDGKTIIKFSCKDCGAELAAVGMPETCDCGSKNIEAIP